MIKYLALVAGVAALASPAFAQRTTGTLVGTVSDNTGAVLPGVNVVLRGEAIMGTQDTTTNQEGFYRFPALPPGSYSLTFTLANFSTPGAAPARRVRVVRIVRRPSRAGRS